MRNYQNVRTVVLSKTKLDPPKSTEGATQIIRVLLDLFLFESKIQEDHFLKTISIFKSVPENLKEDCASFLWSYKYSFIRRDYFSVFLRAFGVFLNSRQMDWVKFYFAASDYQSDDLRKNIDINFDEYYFHLESLIPSFAVVSTIIDSKIDYNMRTTLKNMEMATNPVNNENIFKWARLFKENYTTWKNDDKYGKYISRVLDIHVERIGVYLNPRFISIMNLRSQFNKKASGTILEVLSSNISLSTVGYKELIDKKRNSIYLPLSLIFLGAEIIKLEEVKVNIDCIDDGNQAWGESILEDIYMQEATDWARDNGYNVD